MKDQPPMTDGTKRAADRLPWQPGPVSTAMVFRCGACDKPSLNQGKKLRRVRGLKTWVCKACNVLLGK